MLGKCRVAVPVPKAVAPRRDGSPDRSDTRRPWRGGNLHAQLHFPGSRGGGDPQKQRTGSAVSLAVKCNSHFGDTGLLLWALATCDTVTPSGPVREMAAGLQTGPVSRSPPRMSPCSLPPPSRGARPRHLVWAAPPSAHITEDPAHPLEAGLLTPTEGRMMPADQASCRLKVRPTAQSRTMFPGGSQEKQLMVPTLGAGTFFDAFPRWTGRKGTVRLGTSDEPDCGASGSVSAHAVALLVSDLFRIWWEPQSYIRVPAATAKGPLVSSQLPHLGDSLLAVPCLPALGAPALTWAPWPQAASPCPGEVRVLRGGCC